MSANNVEPGDPPPPKTRGNSSRVITISDFTHNDFLVNYLDLNSCLGKLFLWKK